MADQVDVRPAPRGDETELFRAFNDELMRAVAQSVRATTPQVIEDACAFAWAKFMDNQPDRDRNWRGWLFRVAQHEAWVLDRAMREHVGIRTSSFDPQPAPLIEPRAPGDRYETALDLGEALSLLGELPERLRRIAMLRALGFRHSEIGELTGDSVTRVGQLVSRAHFGIAEARAERAAAESPLPPRAQRLRELEQNPPSWLVERIGRMPTGLRKRSDHALRHRAWRRAALALDDYCRHAGEDAVRGDAFARAPTELPGRCLHKRAIEAVEALLRERGEARDLQR